MPEKKGQTEGIGGGMFLFLQEKKKLHGILCVQESAID
jgi:hypothetical protein